MFDYFAFLHNICPLHSELTLYTCNPFIQLDIV